MAGDTKQPTDFPIEPPTRREREVLALLEKRLTNPEIARELTLALSSVKWYVQQIYGKLGVNNRRQAVARARELGLLEGLPNLVIPASDRGFFIRSALGDIPHDAALIPIEPKAPYPSVHGLEPHKQVHGNWDRFVGRERELTWLYGQLDRMLEGKGKIAFIAGDAGRGKTALMMEFVRRAVDSHPGLIASGGICSAYAGIGDPYLPFREALGFLTGDVETHWFSNTYNLDYGQRVWQALPHTLQVLAEHAPYLLEALVPGKALLSRAVAVEPGGANWLSHLQYEVTQRLKAASNPEQTAVFGQFNSLLFHLSRRQPLLIVLDDLHWADDASLGLLFHLARHLFDSRIFILGTYRPEELASSHNTRRPLLEIVLGELKLIYGDITIDLIASDQAGGRYFVDTYLNGLPSQFSAAFHQALYQRTGGHPLFTVEFVREMQARGDLVLNDKSQWREADNLDWTNLPVRVEAVIAQRFGRLDANLINILTVACVEGELFNAEVVAYVLGTSEWELLQQLSQALAKRHQLVQARGETRLSDRVLSPYTFRHALFQQYLYHQLDPGERRRLHGAVAEALEALYQDEVETIAAQLAWHHQEARQAQKSIEYLEMAGKRAIRLSGYEEAVYLLQRGLALFDSIPLPSQQIRQQIEMLLALGEAYHWSGKYEESLDTFKKAAVLARDHDAPQALARAALGYENARWLFNFPTETSRGLLEEALEHLGDEDNLLKVRLKVGLARARMPIISQMDYDILSEQAIEMARSVGDPLTLFDALQLSVFWDQHPQHSSRRLEALNEMLRLAESTGDISRQYDAIHVRTLEDLRQGDLTAVLNNLESLQKINENAHIPLFTYGIYIIQTTLAIMMGNFTEAESLAQKVLKIGNQLKVKNADGIYGIHMFSIRREQGRLNEIAPVVKLFVEQHSLAETWRPGLALIYSDLDLRAETYQAFESLAAQYFTDLPKDALWLTCIAYLSEVCAYLGDINRAAYLYKLLLPYTGWTHVTGNFGACYGAVDRYLGLLATTLSHWVDAERHFQNALAMNIRLEALPWLAHTQHAYADMLLKRGLAGDQGRAIALLDAALGTARSLGMNALIGKVEKLK